MKTRSSFVKVTAGRAALVAAFGFNVLACANIFGFDDLTLNPDASTAPPAPDGGKGGGGDDAVADAETESSTPGDDAPETDDTGLDSSEPLFDATPDGNVVGDADTSRDAAGTRSDAGDGGLMAACMLICSGCCDSNAHCQGGSTTAVCGTGGQLCSKCPSCGGVDTVCCTKGVCGCALALCPSN
jgi:hypothetical protein